MVEAIIAIIFYKFYQFPTVLSPKHEELRKSPEEIERTSNYKAKPYIIPSIPIQFTRSKRSTSGIVHVYCYQFAWGGTLYRWLKQLHNWNRLDSRE